MEAVGYLVDWSMAVRVVLLVRFGLLCFALIGWLVGLVWLVGRLMWFGQCDLVGWLISLV